MEKVKKMHDVRNGTCSGDRNGEYRKIVRKGTLCSEICIGLLIVKTM